MTTCPICNDPEPCVCPKFVAQDDPAKVATWDSCRNCGALRGGHYVAGPGGGTLVCPPHWLEADGEWTSESDEVGEVCQQWAANPMMFARSHGYNLDGNEAQP